jgi:hypothetical protein
MTEMTETVAGNGALGKKLPNFSAVDFKTGRPRLRHHRR